LGPEFDADDLSPEFDADECIEVDAASMCMECKDGGNLLVCEAACHAICVFLEEGPPGDWFCSRPECHAEMTQALKGHARKRQKTSMGRAAGQ
jgi:hypothetical protein